MKKIKSISAAITAFVLLAIALPARADNFNITNGITFATAYSFAVTNVVGTNGVATGTGTAIAVPNWDKGAFTFTGANSTTNIGNCIVTLVRSTKQSPPAALTDFETTPVYTLTVPMNGTNVITWVTNLDAYAIGACSYIAVFSLTNTAAAGTVAAVATFTPKTSVIKFP